MNIQPLSKVIGAEISGIDLRQDLSPLQLREIDHAFSRYHLLLFRNQEVTFEEQTRFAEHFGPAIGTHKTTDDGQMFVSNTVKDGAAGNGSLGFHQDHSFFDVPDTNEILLYALEVPATGGETVFANAQQAYDDLPEPLKTRIAGLHGLHIAGTGARVRGEPLNLEHLGARTHAIQPLVWKQRDTGKAVLYVSQLVDNIVELKKDESEALLSQLEAHLYREELLYRHKWRVGDLIIWNNRILQHGRTDFDPSENRTLRRSTMGVPEKITEEWLPVGEAGV